MKRLRTHSRPGGLTWAQYGAVCDALKQGEAVTSIAKRMGRSETTMHEWLRRAGVLPPPKPRAKRGTAPRKGHQFDLLEVWR